MLLDGRTAVITGGGQGIGCAIARVFVEQGCAVVLADINGERIEHEAESLTKAGHRATWVRADVSIPDDVHRAVETAVQHWGSLDVMVNNAGVPHDAPITEMSFDVWQEVIDVHLRGAWLGTKAAAQVMSPRRRGSIINMSSISGKVGLAGQTNYSAAKAGVIGLTKAAAKDLGPSNVRVNAIAPGTIGTERTLAAYGGVWERKVADVPLGRAGEPEEIATAALFLASDLASYVTGTLLEVTGGRFS